MEPQRKSGVIYFNTIMEDPEENEKNSVVNSDKPFKN